MSKENPGIQLRVAGQLIDGGFYLLKDGVLNQLQQDQSPRIKVDIPKPDARAFHEERTDAAGMLIKGSPQPAFQFDRVEYPEDGGIFVYLKGLKYPTKGFPFPEACEANNSVKRIFINQLRYFISNPLAALPLITIKGLERWLESYSDISYIILQRYLFKDIRYNRACREIRKFLETFLVEYGISVGIAETFSKIFVTMLEYDNAYLLRVQDLANETVKEKLFAHPIKELKRLLAIFRERDSMRVDIHKKFGAVMLLLSVAFWLPRVRRAFYKALDGLRLENIQMDEGDRYLVLRWADYKFLGRTDEDRHKEFIRIHNGAPPQGIILTSQNAS